MAVGRIEGKSKFLEDALQGKKVLIVDDEPDVLETLEELLSMCRISKANSFALAKEQLENRSFDFAILDIKGVDGYGILKIARKKKIPAVMLTGYTKSRNDPLFARQEGADYYVPKEKMDTIENVLNDIMEAKRMGKSSWESWKDRFGSYFKMKFPPVFDSAEQSCKEKQANKWEKYFY